jgi:signal transduction histidine kinase
MMTSLPIAPFAAKSEDVACSALSNSDERGASSRKEERFLLRAFRSFSDVAASLEHSYGELQTEVRHLRNELERSRADLEQAEQKLRREQALAEMSAVLAHEIRNPLGSLELFAGLLAESAVDADSKRWIGHIQAGLRTLAATVNNVLHFHSLPEPERAPVDLGRLLDWAEEFLAPLAQQAKVGLSSKHGLAEVEMAADRHRLEQVLLNLVLNAIRATPEGGRIKIEGRLTAEGIAIIVADTGSGIPSERLEKIFDPGFSTRTGSPGLGLTVCRKIVEQHGGSIAVSSRPGEGTAFTVQFPLEPAFRGGLAG